MSEHPSIVAQIRELCDRAGYYTKLTAKDERTVLMVLALGDKPIQIHVDYVARRFSHEVSVFNLDDEYEGAFADAKKVINVIQAILSPIEEDDTEL